jgi:hypothetical protein
MTKRRGTRGADRDVIKHDGFSFSLHDQGMKHSSTLDPRWQARDEAPATGASPHLPRPRMRRSPDWP